MEREKLERSFCWKISGELKLFKYRVLQKEKEEIYALAYQIDSMISIYEVLAELSQKMEVKQLQNCIAIPELLTFFYQEWLKTSDFAQIELEQTLWSCIQGISESAA